MTVRVMSALPASIHVMFSPEKRELRDKRTPKADLGKPSEGRGQRFESSWVRHFLSQICPCFRPSHPLLFAGCSDAKPCTQRRHP